MRRLALVLPLLAACDDTLFDGQEEVIATEGWEGVRSVVQSDTCQGCHNAASSLGGLDLETDPHGAMVGVTGDWGVVIVEPGDPGASMLYKKITATQGANGTDMPPGSGGLDATTGDIVANWILDGAPAE